MDDKKLRTKEELKELPLKEAVEVIRQHLTLDPTNQYRVGGKVFQVVATIKGPGGVRVPVSLVVDHTPNSKYTGAMLREIRAKQAGLV